METRRSDLTPDRFEPLDVGTLESERIVGRPIGFWEDSWSRLKKNRGALISLFLIILLFVMAFLVGPLLSRYSPFAQDLTRSYVGPSKEFWFGTDNFGRDMWTRVWAGTRVSLYIALLAAVLDLFVGVPFGAVSGFMGGKVDGVMQRAIEILNGILTISIAIGLTGWTYMARIVRGKMLQLKDQEFALASRSLGASRSGLVWKHLIPNSLGPIIISVMFTIPDAIFAESFLSFIGLGIQIPRASLGSLISDGTQYMQFHPYLLWFPTAILCLIMVSFTLFGDGLRDALDPRMRK